MNANNSPKPCPMSLSFAVLLAAALVACHGGEESSPSEPTGASASFVDGEPAPRQAQVAEVEEQKFARPMVAHSPGFRRVGPTLPAPRLTHEAFAFPPTHVGASTGELFSIHNDGDAPFFFELEVLPDANTWPDEFLVDIIGAYDPEAGLAPGASLPVQVSFRPRGTGAHSAQLVVRPTHAGLDALAVAASGEGVYAGRCVWSVSAKTLDFGEVPSKESVDLALEVKNEAFAGNVPCELRAPHFMKAAAGFSVPAANLPAMLAPGDSATVVVRFDTTDLTAGEYGATLLLEVDLGYPGERVVPVMARVTN